MIRELRAFILWIFGIFGPGLIAYAAVRVAQGFGVEFFGGAYAPQAAAWDIAKAVTYAWFFVVGVFLISAGIHSVCVGVDTEE